MKCAHTAINNIAPQNTIPQSGHIYQCLYESTLSDKLDSVICPKCVYDLSAMQKGLIELQSTFLLR